MTTADTRPPVFGVHHTAYRCRDAEETRAFYEDKLGFPMTLALEIEEEPSTGNPLKYMHVFFDIGSHKADAPSYIAFFELPDTPADETTFAQKMGLRPASRHAGGQPRGPGGVEEAAALWRHLGQGPIDHGICSSIYFSDPNGYVLEFAAENVQERATMARETSEARANLAKWNAWKAAR